MTRKARGIAKKTDELLDTRQKARLAQLTAIERVLVLRMLMEIRERVETRQDGTTTPISFLKTARLVDRVFDLVEESELGGITKSLIGDMKGVLKFNADYFSAMDVKRGKAFKAIRAAVDRRMRERLGITSEDGAQKGGYIDKLFATQAAREEVKKLIAKQVQAGLPMKKLERLIRLQLQGTKTTAGVLERNLGGFVLDTYNIADAVTNKEFAKRLDLKYFIYSGGLIETSREFCRKHNNKVFTTEEAEKEWPKDILRMGPMTKIERETKTLTDYAPLEDRGRWSCRHRILYIPYEEAVRLRPDLKKSE